MSNTTQFRDIPGYPGYRAGDDGSVWSNYPVAGGKRDVGWHRLKAYRHPDRRYQVVGVKDEQGNRRPKPVHLLVLMAFTGSRPSRMDACHIDGDSLNNRRDNLRWGTRSSNNLDKRRHGTQTCGERSRLAKLTEQQVRDIRAMAHGGVMHKEIAAHFGVSKTAIHWIVHRKSWAHVD